MKIQAVFFDMGGTIETLETSRELRLAAMPELRRKFEAAALPLPKRDEDLFEQITRGLDRYHAESVRTMHEAPPFTVWRDYVFPEFSGDTALLEERAEDLMMLTESLFYRRTLRPEVPGVLDALRRRGLKVGMISNINSRGLVPDNLRRYGIRDFFEPVVLSSEYRRRKPDPAIFHYAARLAGVPAGACAYVGDRIIRDIAGARAAGFPLALQIRHRFDHGETETGPEPDGVMDSMEELLSILDRADGAGLSGPENQTAIRAVLFDAGDILYYRPEKGKNFRAFLEETGLEESAVPPEIRRDLRDKAFRGEITQEQQRRELVLRFGVTDEKTLLRGCEALEKDDNNVRFFPGVRETLLALKERGFMLGIITDTANPLYVKLSWFARGGFGHVWDSIISSQEVGIEKPDPAIYAACLVQLGLEASQALFVGHSPEELEGARKAGMPTAAFNYPTEAEADSFVETFPDLLSLAILNRQE